MPMSLKDELIKKVSQIFSDNWEVNETRNVPDLDDLKLTGNHAKLLKDATVLYADIDGSTAMVDDHPWEMCAEIYESYMRCAATIIRAEGGKIRAYDGDRIMGIFPGSDSHLAAVKAAMKIECAVKEIIQPAISRQYPQERFSLRHVIGIDRSDLHAARIGVRDGNDLVWIGRAANYAAKLTMVSGKPIWVTLEVWQGLPLNFKGANGKSFWVMQSGGPLDGVQKFGTDCYLPID